MNIKEWLFTWSPRKKLFVSIASVVFVLDQWSKFWAVDTLTHAMTPFGGESELDFFGKLDRFLTTQHPIRASAVTVLKDFWHFRYAENPGAAWSFLATAPDWFRAPFFLAITVVAMGFIITYFNKTTPEQKSLRIALALVFGGALGNFFDRARLGYVIDFIDWHWYDKATWPTFNVADAAISIGVGLMVLDMLLHPEKKVVGVTTAKSR